jgi:hypothetical protein
MKPGRVGRRLMRLAGVSESNLCEHPKVMIEQSADQRRWCFFCANCHLYADKARTRKAAERKWRAMVKAQAAWRLRA